MIQAIVRKGKVIGENIPAPVLSDGGVLIKVVNSCISAGTEISGISVSGRSLTKQAIEQPAKVRNALNYISLRGFNLGIDEIRSSTGRKGNGKSWGGYTIH